MNITFALLLALSLAISGCQTSYRSEAGSLGRPNVVKVSDREYVIKTVVGGFTSAAQLKPQTLLIAREVGAKKGFSKFQVVVSRIEYSLQSGTYSVTSAVRFYKNDERIIENKSEAFSVAQGRTYKDTEILNKESYATIKARKFDHPDFSALSVDPVFFEAAGREPSNGFNLPTYYLEAGRHRMISRVYVYKGFNSNPYWFYVEHSVELKAGESYEFRIRMEGEPEVWIENARSGKRVSSGA